MTAIEEPAYLVVLPSNRAMAWRSLPLAGQKHIVPAAGRLFTPPIAR